MWRQMIQVMMKIRGKRTKLRGNAGFHQELNITHSHSKEAIFPMKLTLPFFWLFLSCYRNRNAAQLAHIEFFKYILATTRSGI